MVEFPTMARRRLNEVPVPESHPDAALLTGFVEHALTPRLRGQVIGHLALCSDCRLLVALATPEMPAVNHQVVFDWRRSLRRAPLRWATGLAAAVVVTASVLVVQTNWVANRHHPIQNATVATSTARPVNAPSPVRQQDTSNEKLAVVVASTSGSKRQHAAHAEPSLEGPMRDMVETRMNVNHTLDLGGQAPAFQDASRVPVPTGDSASSTASTSKIVWMIAGSGIVYESFDDGQRWQSVSIRDGVSFRSVTSIGSTVWAGGDAGTLFKSEDNGLHWTRLNPWGDSQVLVSDSIQRVEFTDLQHGSVVTSGGNVLVTSDGGQTWHKR